MCAVLPRSCPMCILKLPLDPFRRYPAKSSLKSDKNYSLVGANTGSLKSLGTQLFVLVGDHVDAQRELIDVRALSSEIEDTNLRVRNTTVESGLRVWLIEFVNSRSRAYNHSSQLQKHRDAPMREFPPLQVVKWRIYSPMASITFWGHKRELHAPCSCSSGNILLVGVPSWMISSWRVVGYLVRWSCKVEGSSMFMRLARFEISKTPSRLAKVCNPIRTTDFVECPTGDSDRHNSD